MEPNDLQPGGPPGRTITIQLTRDTLVLLAALLFLGVAILLAVFFPGASSGTPTPTSVAGIGTAQGQSSATRQTAAATVVGASASTPAGGAPFATAVSDAPNAQEPGYPEPNDQESNQDPDLNLTPEGDFSEQRLTATAQRPQLNNANSSPTAIPAFQPTRFAQPTAAGGSVASQTTAYPAPQTVAPAGAATAAQAQRTAAPEPTDEPLFADTPAPNPTVRSQPAPQPTQRPAPLATATPRRPQPTTVPAPTVIPVDVLRGTVRWTTAQSPILLKRDQQLVASATLLIEPGVEVQLAPGVSFFIEGTMYAIGRADQPIRFVGSESQRWEGLFGRPGSNIAMEYTDIRGGGAGGTVLTSEGGNLVLHHTQINNNGGHIQVNDSRLEMRDSEIAGNDMPYGSALEASYASGGFVILTNNRIGGNRMQAGTSPVRISNLSGLDTVNLDIVGNLLVGQEGPDLVLSANGPLQGGLSCNAFVGGTNGLSVRGDTPQVPGFALSVHDNATEKHTPPIIPEYLKYGIGRGATSEIVLDMRNNWWGNPIGPYEPDRYADGRGESVGDNIDFAPWLTERPACAPKQ